MFKVKITYKSGKVETTNIAINKYVGALEQLASEQRTVSIEILEMV